MACNLKNFSQKVVLVTGSSGGIGLATVKYFARCGALVVVNGRNQEAITKAAAECDQLSPNQSKALQIQADVTKEEDCKRLVDAVIQQHGKIDILVNNAGGGAFSSIYDPKLLESLDRMYNLNMRSMAMITQMAVPHLEKTKGVIVNLSSTLALKPMPVFLPYCAAKAAMDMFAKCLAVELGPKGIRVNNVNPTAVPTNFQAAAGAGSEFGDFLKSYAEKIPLRRITDPEDVVQAIAYLSSPESSYVNGHSLVVDGGSIYI